MKKAARFWAAFLFCAATKSNAERIAKKYKRTRRFARVLQRSAARVGHSGNLQILAAAL
jgi:hypothetical protein